jgi:hypothetical protein
MVEHAGGPVLLCSFLDPAEEDNTQSTSTSTQGVAEEAESEEPQQQVAEGGGGDVPDLPPMLISIVVGAGEEDTMEARRTAGQLERMGRAIQREWAAGGGLEGDGDGDGDGDGAA